MSTLKKWMKLFNFNFLVWYTIIRILSNIRIVRRNEVDSINLESYVDFA